MRKVVRVEMSLRKRSCLIDHARLPRRIGMEEGAVWLLHCDGGKRICGLEEKVEWDVSWDALRSLMSSQRWLYAPRVVMPLCSPANGHPYLLVRFGSAIFLEFRHRTNASWQELDIGSCLVVWSSIGLDLLIAGNY